MKGVDPDDVPKAAKRHGEFLLNDAIRRYPAVLRMAAKGGRQVGNQTRQRRREILAGLLVRLCSLGYYPRTVDDLKSKHVRALVRDAEQRKVSSSTFSGYSTCLKRLCRAIGKPQLVDDVNGYLLDRKFACRSGVARFDKSLEGGGISFTEIRTKAMEIDPRVACILELCFEFGMRVREAWQFRPALTLQGGVICIFWGCKGGRKRQLPFAPTEKHIALVGWAKSFVRTDAESMIPRGVKLHEWKARWQRAMTKIGLTRKQLGRTPHALRHSFLCRYFSAVSDHEPPVRGGTLHRIDPHADRAARELVGDAAGHGRPSVSAAYVGGATDGVPRSVPTQMAADDSAESENRIPNP
jgi:integrase